MKKRKFEFDLIVLGTGAGGSAAANIAAKNGLKVAVVENDLFGGESPNYGEIPVRALSNAVKIIWQAKKSSKMGKGQEDSFSPETDTNCFTSSKPL